MDISDNFLDNLLDSAVTFYNDKKVEKKSLPTYFENPDDAINLFENALRFEANKAMTQEIIVNELPILHAVNLNTNAPGIIKGETNQKKLFYIKKKRIYLKRKNSRTN